MKMVTAVLLSCLHRGAGGDGGTHTFQHQHQPKAVIPGTSSSHGTSSDMLFVSSPGAWPDSSLDIMSGPSSSKMPMNGPSTAGHSSGVVTLQPLDFMTGPSPGLQSGPSPAIPGLHSTSISTRQSPDMVVVPPPDGMPGPSPAYLVRPNPGAITGQSLDVMTGPSPTFMSGPSPGTMVPPAPAQPGILLGTFLRLGGGILGMAGQIAQQTGDFIQNTGKVVEGSGELLARALDHGGQVVAADTDLVDVAGRGLICSLVCPSRVGMDRYVCQAENCQAENEIGRSWREGDRRVGNDEAEGLLQLGGALLGMGTRLLADIAFLKLRLLQGLFSRPDCWSSWRNNDNSCISQLCNTTGLGPPRRQGRELGACGDEPLGPGQVLVDTVHGPVIGRGEAEMDPRFQERVEWDSFTGIPYAQPPIGPNRFRPPQTPVPWQCPLDATHRRNRICPQINFGLENDGLLAGSNEDCLYLNVYRPRHRNSSSLLPVAVWLHGGAFMFGSGSACWFGPQFWMIHGIVLVTLNYRLGPLGFLSLGSEEVPGNAGMLDQVAALQWVQANIHRFGGDPGMVTLMGQSAGSFSTTYHLVSPKSRGLFHRIIAQSGVGGFSPSYHHYSERQAVKFGTKAAALVGCTDERTRVGCLRSKKVAEVMTMDVRNELLSQPVVDGAFTSDPFLPRDPKELIREGKYNDDVEILLGFNEEEGHMVTSVFEAFPLLYSAMAAGWPILGPFTLLNKHHTEISPLDNTMANTILMEYVGNVSAIKAENLQQITNMFTDSFFSYGISKFLDYYLPKAKTKTYQYIFSYKEHSRASHSSELPLLWGVFKGKQQIASQGEKRMSKLLTTMWSNFMKFGNPTPNPVDKIKWLPSSEVKREYLVIGKETKMATSLSLLRRLSIWKAVLGED